MIKGTQAEQIIAVLERIPLRVRNKVTEVTMDMAANIIKAIRRCFGNAQRVIDRFHVQKLVYDAIQEARISLLNHTFITGFEFYLKTECKCSGVSAAKYIKHLKKIVNHCIANSWLKQNPFINYKSTAKAKERTYLTQQELDKIANKEFSIERLAHR